jgi:hypothetical protein
VLKLCLRVLCVSRIEALGSKMRLALQILAMIAAVVVAGVATYFIVTFLLQFF